MFPGPCQGPPVLCVDICKNFYLEKYDSCFCLVIFNKLWDWFFSEAGLILFMYLTTNLQTLSWQWWVTNEAFFGDRFRFLANTFSCQFLGQAATHSWFLISSYLLGIQQLSLLYGKTTDCRKLECVLIKQNNRTLGDKKWVKSISCDIIH